MVVGRGLFLSATSYCWELVQDAVLQLDDDQTFFSSSGIDHNTAPGLNRKKRGDADSSLNDKINTHPTSHIL